MRDDELRRVLDQFPDRRQDRWLLWASAGCLVVGLACLAAAWFFL